MPDRRLEDTVNLSIIESVGRSINTSFTTLMVLLAMLLIGGDSIRELLLVVAIGVVVGTYSSIFVAAQFLVIWERRGVRAHLHPGASGGGGVIRAGVGLHCPSVAIRAHPLQHGRRYDRYRNHRCRVL